jgi:hypothetical protein
VTISEPIPRRTLLLALAGAACAALLGTLVRSDDPDLFHHLALGREIARDGLFIDERLVFPTLGEPVGVAPYWLGSVVIYLWHLALGNAGISFLPAALGAVLCVLLLVDAAPRGGRHTVLTLAAAALPVALALETYRYRAVPRPEVFGAVFLAWTMWALRRLEEGRILPLLFFPAVAALWSNLHPSTAIALVPIALFALGSAADAAVARWRGGPAETRSLRPALIAAACGAAGLLATAARPGYVSTAGEAFRFALAALRLGGGAAAGGQTALGTVARHVQEMQGGGTELWATPVGALIVLCAISFVASWRTLRVREVLTVVALAVLPFAAVRFALFFAVVAAPIAGRNLGAALSRLPERSGSVPVRALAAALALLALLALLAALASLPYGAQAPHIRFGSGIATELFPVRPADYLDAARFGGRLFNTFHLGGYLEWRRIGPPYQDGRGSRPAEDEPGATTGPLDRASFAPVDARWRFDALVLAYPAIDPEVGRLLGPRAYTPDPETWALVAFDDGGLLYLRRDGRYSALAAQDEFRVASPANPFLLQAPPEALPGILAELRRSVVEAPRCVRCRWLQAEVALACGLPAEAATAAAEALPLSYGEAREALRSVAARAAAALPAGRAPRP